MSEQDIGKLITNQLIGLLRDSQYSHISTVDAKYSYLHDNGKVIMAEMIDMIIPRMAEILVKQDKERAEKLMLSNLKS